MQKYYFLLCCLFNIFRVEAQSIEVDLENKYWNYRDRLKKNFVQIGSAPGQSITAAQLLEFSSPSDTLQYQNGILKKVEPKTYKNRMVFGDVLVDQGYYLAVLSSELNILTLEGKQNSERYKSVCVELYWAIYAIDRLDAKAEEYLNYSILGIKNGFLIRSDNDEKFLSRVAPLKKLDPQRVDFLNSGGANGCHFQIEPGSWDGLPQTESSITIPKPFLLHIATITTGTARGVLSCKTEGTPFATFIIPTVDLTKMVLSDAEFALK